MFTVDNYSSNDGRNINTEYESNIWLNDWASDSWFGVIFANLTDAESPTVVEPVDVQRRPAPTKNRLRLYTVDCRGQEGGYDRSPDQVHHC